MKPRDIWPLLLVIFLLELLLMVAGCVSPTIDWEHCDRVPRADHSIPACVHTVPTL